MSNFLRSNITKAAAFLLILICAAVFAASVADIMYLNRRGSSVVYEFESSFEESRTLQRMKATLRAAARRETIDEARKFLSEFDYAEYYIIGSDGVAVANSSVEGVKACPWWFSLKSNGEEPAETEPSLAIDYEAVAPEDDSVYSEGTYVDSDNFLEPIPNTWTAPYAIYAGIAEEKYYELESLWLFKKSCALTDAYLAGGLLLLALALWIYLLAVSGRRKGDDGVHTLSVDRCFIEILVVPAAVAVAMLTYGSMICAVSLIRDEGYADDAVLWLAVIMATAATGIFVAASQSVVRNIKNKTFASRLLSVRVLRGLKRALLFLCGNRITAVILVLFAAYTILLLVLADSVIGTFAVFAAAAYFMYRYLVQLDKIKTGIFKIHDGETDYKIEGCKAALLSETADTLNSINEGVKAAVERETAAQRMKSELITNVSHDLKTPLTSIISYADLLASTELSPKEANDYARIIKQKSDRLKKLTDDLFDISKAESGSETVSAERLDMALLLRQSLAELNSEIEKSDLDFVLSIPEKEIFVNADGKKLSRVFENLIVNAVKYSMKGTRVYVGITEKEGEAVAYIKNISAAPMNFSPSEITERFVRGDASRTTEGSGLGLAIAENYVKLCGGRLELCIDGDLFKAEVILGVVK